MIWILLSFALFAGPKTDSVVNADTVAMPDSTQLVSDSAQQAKLEAIQRAWDGDSASRRDDAASERSVGSTIAQIVASLAVLLALAGFVFLILRKVRNRSARGRSGSGGSLIDVLENRPLGHGNHVSLVRVHDRVIAVGHGPGGVSGLAEFRGTEAAGILAETGDGAVSVKDFTATLDTFLERFRAAPPGSPEERNP